MTSDEGKCATPNGVVLRIEGGRMVVGVERSEACGSCSARRACGAFGSAVHEVVVPMPNCSVCVGDRVTLGVSEREGRMAMLVAYVVPFVIVLLGLLILLALGVNEGIAGLVSIGLMVPYYVVLYLLRGRLETKISVKSVQKEE